MGGTNHDRQKTRCANGLQQQNLCISHLLRHVCHWCQSGIWIFLVYLCYCCLKKTYHSCHLGIMFQHLFYSQSVKRCTCPIAVTVTVNLYLLPLLQYFFTYYITHIGWVFLQMGKEGKKHLVYCCLFIFFVSFLSF